MEKRFSEPKSQREISAAWLKVQKLGVKLNQNSLLRRRLITKIVLAVQDAKRIEKQYAWEVFRSRPN